MRSIAVYVGSVLSVVGISVAYTWLWTPSSDTGGLPRGSLLN